MRKFNIVYLILPFMATACTKYQYATVSSNMKSNDREEYIYENDTMLVRYGFKGEDGPVKITIQNKMSTPLYVDWQRSAIVLNGESNTYFQDRTTMNASVQGVQFNWSPTFSSNSSSIHGELKRDEAVAFIAPVSQKQARMTSLDSKFFAVKRNKDTVLKINAGETDVTAYAVSFDQENTPLKFRSFLTLSADASFQPSFVLDHTFWVSEVIDSPVPLDNLYDFKDENKYYKRKTTGFGAFLGVTAIIAALLLAASVN